MNYQTRVTELLSSIIGSYLVIADGDKFENEGKRRLEETLSTFVDNDRPVEIVLPGFPFKSLNFHAKTSGPKPDYGEVLALRRLDEMCQAIVSAYPRGVSLTVVSDGTTFNDIIGVSDADRRFYDEEVRTLWSSPHIRWASLEDLVGRDGTSVELRAGLIEKAALPYADLSAFIEAVGKDAKLTAAHDQMCNFLYNDLRPRCDEGIDEEAYFAQIRDKSYEMMYRSQALSAVLNQTYPEAVRLSVHQYDNSGPKYTFAFIEGAAQASAPWHKVTHRDLEGRLSYIDHARIDPARAFAIHRDGQVWIYQESDENVDPAVRLSIVRPPQFGLLIEGDAPGSALGFSPRLMKSLVSFFSFVCMRDCGFEDRQELVEYCQPFGDIYQWHFGPVHVVQPEEKPTGFVQSLEKTPIHWDLSMLPLDHERVKDDEWFCADLFMLYCRTPPQSGEGQTVLVDGREILHQVGPETVELWRSTNITYNTKMTYFGGHPRTYPLVHTHPFTKEPILRYQEGSRSQYQTFSQEVEGLAPDESAKFIEDMNQRIYAAKVCYEHDWKAGDLILVDNYLALHGRNPMTEASSQRELWRVQTVS
ncbi:L-tyrosine/L-tryptophan isonitrile synthase family protein [Breoghania sp. JC706]|uniref:isocyanide synthase family protein n=1 Tax=Breoghania sp. JC706 TaxID=3117732 RepID=UPI003007FD69